MPSETVMDHLTVYVRKIANGYVVSSTVSGDHRSVDSPQTHYPSLGEAVIGAANLVRTGEDLALTITEDSEGSF